MILGLSSPDLTDDEQATINRLISKLNAKSGRNILRASYYDGKRAVSDVGTVIPPQYYKLGLALGWTSKAVDLLARRCTLDKFVWPDGDLDSLGGSELSRDNSLRLRIAEAVTSSLIHSTAFLITTRGSGNEPAALLHIKDAMNATGEINPRTGRLVNLLSIVARDDEGQVSELAFYLPNLTISLVRFGWKWAADRQEHPWGLPAEALVYRPRVGREFGSSRISRPLMALQDAALRELIRLEGHMDVYSWPEMWMLGADESIFKNADGTQRPNYQILLGRIKGIPDDSDRPNDPNARADIKQFAAASPQPHLADLNALAKLFARESSLPDTALAITDVSNPTSAESYDASQYELIAEAEGATDGWSPPLDRTFARLLAIANGENGVPDQWSGISSKWRDPRYLSRAAQADAGMKQMTAVPWLAETEVGLELLGLDDQQIRRAMAEKQLSIGQNELAAIINAGSQTQQQVNNADGA